MIEFDKGEYFLHPAIRAEAISRLRASIEWKKANQKAAEFWTESVETIRSINDVVQIMEAYHHYIDISDLKSAGEILISQRQHEKENASVFISLGSLLFQYGLLGASVFKIEDIIKNISSETYLYARLHNILGNHYVITGNPKKAISFHYKCLESANRIKNSSLIYASLINIGHHYLHLLESKKGIEYLEKIFPILNSNSEYEDKDAFEAYSYLAYAKSIQGELKDATRLANCFLNLSKPDTLQNYNEAYTLAFIGKTFVQLHDFYKAVYTLTKAANIAYKYSFPEVSGIVYVSMAKINYQQNNLDTSAIFCRLGIETLDEIHAICDLAEAYFQLGLTYQAMGKHDQAEEYKVKALELFTQMEAPKQIERVNQAFGGNIQ